MMASRAQQQFEADGFREGLAKGELRVPVCDACGASLDYAQRLCSSCGSDVLGWRRASGQGLLRSVVEISVSFVADLPAPYLIASVELVEGPHILARYHGDWEDAHGEQAVVAFVERGVLGFAPADRSR